MISSDLALSRRLERAEGHACVQFAEAHRLLFPESGGEWMECGGAYAVFDGAGSPVTQTFGLGIFEELSTTSLDVIERFFLERGAEVLHEVSPFAGVAALSLLCARQYRPIEISSVMYRPIDRANELSIDRQVDRDVDQSVPHGCGEIRVRVTVPDEARLWSEVSARGWTHEHPEFSEFLLRNGAISSARAHSVCFLAELDGQSGAAGAMCIHEGVALFAGSATIPEMRRRGLQSAMIEERMRYAFELGLDLAMMVAQAGSDSQRNAERQGFRIAYTRVKWHLSRAT